MKIAIKFGDNDFGSTFRPIMATLWQAYLYNDGLPLTKEQLLIIINGMSSSFYLAFQSQFKPSYKTPDDYLYLDENQLLIDEEVDEYLKRFPDGNDNSSTYILDTELYSNNVYVV